MRRCHRPSRALWLALATSLLAAGGALALDQEASGRFVVADPTGAFGEAVTSAGFGLAGQYGLRLAPAFTLGLGLHGLVYGSESRRYDLPLVDDFDLTTTNNLAGAFLYGRSRLARGSLQPYAEARAGLNYLWTESKLEDDEWWGDDEVARETNYDDFAAFWGIGGGLLIRLSKAEARRPSFYLDLAVARWWGARAEYLTEGAVAIVDERPVFTPRESETDLMTYELGVTITF